MFGTGSPALSRDDLIDWLRLIRSENVGPVTFRNLLAHYGSARAALDALPELSKRGGRKRPVKICSRSRAERELADLDARGARVLALGSDAYPPALAAIDDAPPLLFVQGHEVLLQRPGVALVGARNASANGRRMARELGAALAADGYLVISGLARGIDAAAHAGALDGGTAAVMAGGIDIVYPPENEALYDEIAARGVLLAEHAPGTEPQARHFPRRNRLISGMARGVVVVEGAQRSGSLISARLAGEQGREVMAVPGSPLDPRSGGCNSLLKQGASLVEKPDDVRRVLRDHAAPGPAEHRDDGFRATGTGGASPDEATLDAARREVTELMGSAPVAVDEIMRECQFSPSIVTMVLLELELAGRCERHPGNRVALVQTGPT
jgi:DNA processing protein